MSIAPGYMSTPYTVRPFDKTELRGPNQVQRAAWNIEHSRARMPVEHAFGDFKGRFPSMKWIAGRDMERIYEGVDSLLTLTNIFRYLGDHPHDIPDFDPEDEATRLEQEVSAVNAEAWHDGLEDNVRLGRWRAQQRETAASLHAYGTDIRADIMADLIDHNGSLIEQDIDEVMEHL